MPIGLRRFLVMFIFYLIQTSIMPHIVGLGIQPDLLACVIVYFTLDGDTYIGFCMGAIAGLLMDAMVGSLAVYYLVLYPLMGYASARFARLLSTKLIKPRQRLLRPLILTAVITAMAEAVMLLYIYINENAADITLQLIFRSVRVVLYSTAVTVPVYFICHFLMYRVLGRVKVEKG